MDLLFTAGFLGLGAAGPQLVVVVPVSFWLLGTAGMSKQWQQQLLHCDGRGRAREGRRDGSK